MNPFAAVLLKVTVLLSAAVVVAALLRRRSAAARHLVWMLSLAGALLLTLASPLLPTIPVRIAGIPAASVRPAAPATEPGVAAVTRAAPTSATDSPLANPDGTAPTFLSGLETADLLLALWILGALGVAGWCLLGHAGLIRLQRRAVPLANPDWSTLTSGIARQSGVQLPIRVFRSRAVGSPVTWGARRPVVLLPDDAESWPAERRHVVLAHELAHAARGDYLAQLIASLVCAVYWFHPLVWVAARRLRMESERACDDLVLLHGVPGVEYAAHLLDVARRSGALRPGGMVAIGMARPSQLEGRLLGILDSDRTRAVPRRRSRIAAWLGIALLVPPLSALRPTPREPALQTAFAEPSPDAEVSDSSFTLSFRASAGDELVLDLESGGSVQIEGWDEPRVEVNARLGGTSWRNTLVTLGPAERGVRLHAWQKSEQEGSSTSHRFEIRVPRRYNVRLNSAGGSISIAGVEGEFSGETGGGELSLARTRGVAELSTGGGDVRVSDSELRGKVSTGGGTVDLVRVRGPLRGSSGSGPVINRGKSVTWVQGSGTDQRVEELRKVAGRIEELQRATRSPGTTESQRERQYREEIALRKKLRELEEEGKPYREGQLRIRKAGGAIEVNTAPEGAELSTGGGPVRVESAGGPISITTGGGDILVARAAGSVRAETGAGDIEITLVGDDGAERTVEVQSGKGSFLLYLPAEFSGRFDLETAYTANFGRRTRIESAWPLEQRESTEWDDRYGTRRKFVRAQGQIGSGAGLIRVRIVNGDITIRRAERRE